jgi:DNA polymerase I-like protein with 3'-5' exonuclease and polymerase domains
VKPNPLLSTGRASYEGLIQLMPRKGGVRPCFKFRGVGCSVDYSAIELSTLAQCCLWMLNYSRLAEAINAEKDPHSILGAQLVNDSYEAFLARLKAGDGATKDLRQAGKAGNFGFPGMMGAPKFVIAKAKEGLRVCELFFRDGRCKQEGLITEWRGRPIGRALCERCVTLAAKLKKTYTDTWTEIPQYWDLVTSEVQRFGTVTQFVSKRVRGGVTEPAAANSLFQGLAADGAKAALVAITNECYSKRRSPLYGSRVVIFAHDEIITDIPDRGPQAVAEAANLQAEIMVREMRRFVPDVRVSAEPALMRYWYKDAVPVFDNGVLVPWAPKEAV